MPIRINDFDEAVKHILTELCESGRTTAVVMTEWNNELFQLNGRRQLGKFAYITASVSEETAQSLQRHLETIYSTSGFIGTGSTKGTYWIGFNLSA